eukprot:6181876-Pleurochrysis_carterae.AAC.1
MVGSWCALLISCTCTGNKFSAGSYLWLKCRPSSSRAITKVGLICQATRIILLLDRRLQLCRSSQLTCRLYLTSKHHPQHALLIDCLQN